MDRKFLSIQIRQLIYLRNSTCPIFKGLMLWLEEAEMKGWRLRFLQASMSLKAIVMSSKFVTSPCRHYVLFCRNQISCQAHPMIIHKFRSCQSNDAIKSLCYHKFAIYFLSWHMNYMSIRQSLMLLKFVSYYICGRRVKIWFRRKLFCYHSRRI